MDKIKFLQELGGPEQKSDDWKFLRKGKITTSAAGNIFGTCKYSTRETVLIEKCLPKGSAKQFNGSIFTFHGERFEKEAGDLYCSLMNKTNYEFGLISYTSLAPIREPNPILDTFLQNNPHIRTDILACSPDGIAIDNDNIEEPVLIEIKCPFKRKIIMGEIPEQYVAQVQLNMQILDLKKADFIEYKPPDPLTGTGAVINIVRIHRDEEYFIKHLPILNKFWAEVEYWRQNDITKHPGYEKYIKDI